MRTFGGEGCFTLYCLSLFQKQRDLQCFSLLLPWKENLKRCLFVNPSACVRRWGEGVVIITSKFIHNSTEGHRGLSLTLPLHLSLLALTLSGDKWWKDWGSPLDLREVRQSLRGRLIISNSNMRTWWDWCHSTAFTGLLPSHSPETRQDIRDGYEEGRKDGVRTGGVDICMPHHCEWG